MTIPPPVKYDKLPDEAVPVLAAVGYEVPDRLKVGDVVPPLTLTNLATDESVPLIAPDATLPTVLIFGSYT